jgi:hypothetical protein
VFIRRFAVKNFMIHRSTSVSLHPISVFVGPNNGGKSALFDALLNFTMVSRGRVSQAFGPGPYSFRSKKSHGVAGAARISFEVELSRGATDTEYLTYSISYSQAAGPADPPHYQIFDERLVGSNGVEHFLRSDLEASPLASAIKYLTEDQSVFAAIRRAQFAGEYEETDPLVTHVAREVSRIGKFRLNPQALSQPSRLPDVSAAGPKSGDGEESASSSAPGPGLAYGGEDLATVLYFLAETGSPVLTEVIDRLRSSVVGFDGFEFNTVGADRVGFSARFDDSRGIVAAANLSDGTLSLVGLSVLLANPSRQPIICIEEPENGLTPRSTRHIYEAVRSAAFPGGGGPASQILISSHSPYVICEAWNGDERDFIYQVTAEGGRALVRTFPEAILGLGLHLEKDKSGKRDRLNLNVADQVMDGYLT